MTTNEQLHVGSATGVDLKLDIAGPGARSYAFVIDWHIRVLFALAWILAAQWVYVGSIRWIGWESDGFASYILVVWVPAVAIYALYHPLLEVLMHGRTPGKRMAGVRIVDEYAQEPSVVAILIRNVLRLLDSLPIGYVVGLSATVMTRQSVRIGDMAAGTLLVFDAGHGLADGKSLQLNTQSTSRYGLDKVELAQDLIERWGTLESSKRCDIARRLIHSVGDSVEPASGDMALRAQLALLFSPQEQETSRD
ncbi:MAG: RDD family protein [Pseudomonadota bacterium]